MPEQLPEEKTDRKKTAKTLEKSEAAKLYKELQEKEILLSLNKDIASIKERNDILRVMLPKVKELFNTDDIFICQFDPVSETLNPFLRVTGKAREDDPHFEKIVTTHFPLGDGFIDAILDSQEPLLFDLTAVATWPAPPYYINTFIAAGLRESLSAVLLCGDNPIGILTLWSEKKGAFTPHHKKLIQRLAYQVSIVVTNISDHEEIKQREKEKEILLTVSKELTSIRDKKDLLPLLKKQFERLSFYNDVTITKVDDDGQFFSAFIINEDSDRINYPGYVEMANAHHRFPDGVFEVALHSSKAVVFDIKELANRPAPLPYIKFIYDTGTIDMVGTALRDGGKEIGALFLFSDRKLSFSELQLSLVYGIGNQLGTVVANILANEEIRNREYEKSILLSLSNEIASVRNKEDFFGVVSSNLKKLFFIEGFAIGLVNEDQKTHSAFLFDLEESIIRHPRFKEIIAGKFSIADGVFDRIMNSADPVIFTVNEIPEHAGTPAYVQFWKKMNIQHIVAARLRVAQNDLGCLFFHLDSRRVGNISNNLLKGVCAQISIALYNILANEKIARQLEEISRYKEQLEGEKQYLQEEVSVGYTYSDIIGNSAEMQKVFHLLSQVAFANSTVLILGETGTGKELIARAIHNSSPRKDKLMVKVNCTTLPPNLIESELFGHEKGSFTGAIDRRIGKFELANNGTLFLDEIGELPPDLQVKLLRALQEKEIERIGGKTTIKVNVRIITATNRQLQKEVDEGRFRQDLFYRLNVFPITLPPLRNRKEDIPLLISHFIDRYARNAGKGTRHLSAKAMKELIAYDWPGNVRELEHLIERTVLMTTGTTIRDVHLPTNNRLAIKTKPEEESLKTHEENERAHIIEVLNKCNGKIYGPGGAAAVLNLRVSTLNSKIKKLGIKKNRLYN